MKKLFYFLLVLSTLLIATVSILLYVDRDIVTYELDQNDVVVKNGEFRFVGRVADNQLVEKIEVYHKKGDKLKEVVLDEMTQDVLADVQFLRDMRFKEKDFSGLKMTTSKENEEDKIYYHFVHDGTEYKHKVLPLAAKTRYFYWNKIHATEVE